MPQLEVIVTGVDEALAAVAGGADRVELVADRARGGLTPELKIIEAVLAAVTIPVHVIARPRDRVRAILEATGAKEIHVGTGACTNGIVSADKVAAIKEVL